MKIKKIDNKVIRGIFSNKVIEENPSYGKANFEIKRLVSESANSSLPKIIEKIKRGNVIRCIFRRNNQRVKINIKE